VEVMGDTSRLFRPGDSPLDAIRHVAADGTEWWGTAELVPFLGYNRLWKLAYGIQQARSACRNSGLRPSDHFSDVGPDVHMTRVGCYLVVMNADIDKPRVAALKRYFADTACAAEGEVGSWGHQPSDHFRDVYRVVESGKGAGRIEHDVMMDGFVMYLLAMGADPDKGQVASMQRWLVEKVIAFEGANPSPPPSSGPTAWGS
jgi:hypothetical protein